jgi:hypothetical protein
LSGASIAIKAYSRRVEDGGTFELFVQDILGGQAFGSNVEFVSTTTLLLVQVAFTSLLPQKSFLNVQSNQCRWGGSKGQKLLNTLNHSSSQQNVQVSATN